MSINIDSLIGSSSYTQPSSTDYSRSTSTMFAQALLKATQKVDSAASEGRISNNGTDDVLMSVLLYLLMSGDSSSAGSIADLFSSYNGSSYGSGSYGSGTYGSPNGSAGLYGATDAYSSGDYDMPTDLSSIGISQAISNPAKYEPIVNAAMARLGDPYSQARAGRGDYTDCSYLSQWCYDAIGVEIPRTAAEQARYCDNNNMTVSKAMLEPGDLVFYSQYDNGRYKDITHVGIYAGNGMMVDASSARGEVVYRKVFDNAVMYGRPR